MVFGGQEGLGEYRGSTEIFNYRDNVWRIIAGKLPFDKFGVGGSTNIDNRILIFGNYNCIHYQNYNMESLTLTKLIDMGLCFLQLIVREGFK